MGFSERVKNLAKYKSAHRCCVCHKPFVEVHHLIPKAAGGPDSIDNSAPLCASCHDLYGGNPEKRKSLRQLRDYRWGLMAERRREVTESVDLNDDSIEIPADAHSEHALDSRSVAIYHLVLPEENFCTSANHIWSLVRSAQARLPNKPRRLYLDIDGHRNKAGGFDHDMFELQRYFLLGFMAQYLVELHMPLVGVRTNKAQANDVPDQLEIIEKLDNAAINQALDSGASSIWVADRDQSLQLKQR